MIGFTIIVLLVGTNVFFINAANDKIFNESKTYKTKESECKCVPYFECEYDETFSVNYTEIIDIRGIDEKRPECPDLQFCCYPHEMKPESSPDEQTASVIKNKFNQKNPNQTCGSRNLKSVFSLPSDLTSAPNFPWSVAVFYRSLFQDTDKICDGSLIHRQVVLTTARCVLGKDAYLTVRTGKWNSLTEEFLDFQYRRVSDVSVHPDNTNQSHDVALLRFETPVELADNVNTLCLPEAPKYFDYDNCITPGYVKNPTDPGDKSKFQLIGQSLLYPIYCYSALKQSKLGQYFPFQDSLMCAKKNGNSDVCLADPGTALVCPMKEDSTRYVQVGMLVWDVHCDTQDVSGVYVDVILNRQWIKDTLAGYNLVEGDQSPKKQPSSIQQSNDPKKNIFYYYHEPQDGKPSQQFHTNYDALENHYPNIYTQRYIKLALDPKYKSSELKPNVQY